jgi:hypothetical protein
MGDTIWVDVDGRGSDELPADNSIVLRLEKNLATRSWRLGVPKLVDFHAYESGWFQKRRWFDPAKALTTVNALHNHLKQSPSDLGFEPTASRKHWPEALLKELAECRRFLEDAVTKGRRFRFLIVS